VLSVVGMKQATIWTLLFKNHADMWYWPDNNCGK